MRLSAYETFCLYIALKNHFTKEQYDFHKYHGKTRISKESFLNRKDRFQFQKLCRKYDDKDMIEFIVANLIHDKKWVGELLDDSGHDNYLQFLKYKQAVTYNFDNELTKALNTTDSLKTLFKSKNGQYPAIIHHYLGKDLSIQTLSILNAFVGFSEAFDRTLGKDDVMWSKIRLLCTKLTSFLEYDKTKIKNILKEKLNEQRLPDEREKESLAEAS